MNRWYLFAHILYLFIFFTFFFYFFFNNYNNKLGNETIRCLVLKIKVDKITI